MAHSRQPKEVEGRDVIDTEAAKLARETAYFVARHFHKYDLEVKPPARTVTTMARESVTVRLAVLALLAVAVVAASALLGPTPPRWGEIFSSDFGNPFWHLRVPRTCLAALAGAGLAVGGVFFQALFRNPLAEPYTLGVASGASLASAIGLLTGISGWAGWFPKSSLLALAGAAAAMGLVYLMARLRRGSDMTHLLLAGVCVAYTSAAGILLVTFLADRAITNEIVRWLMGSLGVYRPGANLEIAVPLVFVLAFGIYSHRALDLLWLGDELAAARGVAVGRTVWVSFVLVGVLTAGDCRDLRADWIRRADGAAHGAGPIRREDTSVAARGGVRGGRISGDL